MTPTTPTSPSTAATAAREPARERLSRRPRQPRYDPRAVRGDHLRQLLAAGLIVDAGEVAVRGGRVRMYRYRPDSPGNPGTGQTAPGDRVAVVDAIVQELRRRYALADWSVRGNLTDAELWVDPDVWTQTATAVSDASLALHAAARPPRTEGAVAVNLTAVLFAMHTTEPGTA